MVSERKKQELAEIKELIEKYPVVGLIDLFKMPSRQLQSVKKAVRKNALIKMCKKNVLLLALKNVTGKENIQKLSEIDVKEPTLIFSNLDSFKLFKILSKNKSPRYAKPGDVVMNDIMVPAGPTSMLAGPAIGEFQRAKIPAMVKEGKIHVREDTVVVKKNDAISAQLANILKKLDIQPIEIGINVLALWENGTLYCKEILDVNEEAYIQNIREGYIQALNLSVNIGYLNKESIKILLLKGYQQAKGLGINAEIFDKGIIENLINKASAEAQVLKTKLNI
jgi:large subunit ribosomal protein L10